MSSRCRLKAKKNTTKVKERNPIKKLLNQRHSFHHSFVRAFILEILHQNHFRECLEQNQARQLKQLHRLSNQRMREDVTESMCR